MASHTPDAATMAQLPDTALVTILQAVPQGHRLRHCAAVSTAWAAAAASATTHVALGRLSSSRHAAFQGWLDKHAGQLVSLRSTGGERGVLAALRLPCAELEQLQTLDLASSSCDYAQLVGEPSQAASSSAQGAAALLPALRAVRLSRVEIPVSNLEVLQQARQLTALELVECQGYRFSALLAGVQQLLELRLQRMPGISDAALAPLSTLTRLQSLSITGSDDYNASFAAASVVSALPLSLTALHLEPGPHKTMFAEVQAGSDSDEDSDLSEESPPMPDASAFLCALTRLTRLRSLQLGEALQVQASAGLSAFSALTASSHISCISVVGDAQPLPCGALRHVFAAGRSRPQLRELRVECSGSHSRYPEDWCVEAADLDAVAAACPGLRSLSLQHVLRSEPQTASSLARLQLTRLELADSTGWLTVEAAATLSQMRGLRELVFRRARDLTDAGFRHMTALRQLTRLYASGLDIRLSEELFGGELFGGDADNILTDYTLELKTPEAKEPDVWRQLTRFVESSQAAARAQRLRIQALEAELARVRAELRLCRDACEALARMAPRG